MTWLGALRQLWRCRAHNSTGHYRCDRYAGHAGGHWHALSRDGRTKIEWSL